jgi:hypothetical protein
MLNIKPETPGLKLCRTSLWRAGLLQTLQTQHSRSVHYYDACLWRVSKLRKCDSNSEATPDELISRRARRPNRRASAGGFAKTSNGHPNIETRRATRHTNRVENRAARRASLTVAARGHYLANLILHIIFTFKRR